MARIVRQTEANECRRCSTFCDRVIAPAGCVAQECPFLYSYDEPLSGRRFMGCMHRVFATEIDVELFREAERTRHGFGGVKLTGATTPRCRTTVERAYHGGGDAFSCVNPRFFDAPADDASTAGFDLRNGL